MLFFFKVRPHIPQLESVQLTINSNSDINMDPNSPSCSGSLDSLDTDLTMDVMEESLSYGADLKSTNIKGKNLSLIKKIKKKEIFTPVK